MENKYKKNLEKLFLKCGVILVEKWFNVSKKLL